MAAETNPLFRVSYVRKMARLNNRLTVGTQVGAVFVIFTCLLSGTGLGTDAPTTGYVWFFIIFGETLALLVGYLLALKSIRRFQAQHPEDYATYRAIKTQE